VDHLPQRTQTEPQGRSSGLRTTAHLRLNASTITALHDFPLGWRFTSQRHALLGVELLARLMPLDGESAARLAGEAAKRGDANNGRPLAFRGDEPPATVRRELLALPIEPTTRIMLSWNPHTALIADWDIFTAHWDDFCYPASDDVTVWPLHGDWTLCYRHYEVFQFWNSMDVAETAPVQAAEHHAFQPTHGEGRA